jgi:PLP dependent protein
METRDRIQQNLNAIQATIREAAHKVDRDPESIKLIPVTKTVGIEEARILLDLGYTHLAENRLHVAQPKIDALGDAVHWHMIGSIQRRKAKDVVALFPRVDSVDRLELAHELHKRCEEQGRTLDILLQVNVSGEGVKHGFTPELLPQSLKEIQSLSTLTVLGLMTMAPAAAGEDAIRGIFRQLRELRDAHGLAELSMGMSNDYRIAIEEGATEVRIGSAIFT